MAQLSFSATVEAWKVQTEEALLKIFQQSASDVIAEMQKVGPSVASTKAGIEKGIGGTGRGRNRKRFQGPVRAAGAGGSMPVDSGFLRSSLVVGINQPLVQANRKNPGGSFPYDPGVVAMTINGAKIGDTITAGYSAAYASVIEYGGRNRIPHAFVRKAALQWKRIVDQNVAIYMKARNG